MRYQKLDESDIASTRITDNDLATHLERSLQTNDPGVLAAALGTIARAQGMSQLARDTGLSRPTLYRALSKDGDPSLSVVLKVAAALGIKVKIVVVTVPGG